MRQLVDIKDIIENNPLALATVDKDNKPNCIAVAFVKVFNENSILITDNYMKKTKDNIKANKNISLAVWDKDWNGYQIKGTATYHDKGEVLNFAKSLKENKDYPAKGAILVHVEQIIPLA